MKDDGIHVAEIFCGVCEKHIDRHTEVDAVFVVDHVEEGVGQLHAKMLEVLVQIREMFLTDEPHLLDGAVESITMTDRLRGDKSFIDPPAI